MRQTLPLKSVRLSSLSGGLPKPWDDSEYVDTFGDIENFFFKGGENLYI